VCWVAVVFFFSLGGFSLSPCFCGVLDWDRLLFLLCFLGSVSTQSGVDGVVCQVEPSVEEVGGVVGVWWSSRWLGG